MNTKFNNFLVYAHDVKCPVCGTKASFTLTGTTSFNSNYCGHLELEMIVEERLNNTDRFYGSDNHSRD